jgi:hypothetical protein
MQFPLALAPRFTVVSAAQAVVPEAPMSGTLVQSSDIGYALPNGGNKPSHPLGPIWLVLTLLVRITVSQAAGTVAVTVDNNRRQGSATTVSVQPRHVDVAGSAGGYTASAQVAKSPLIAKWGPI